MKSDVLSLPLQAPIGITHTQIYLCTCILLNMLLVIMLTMFAQYIVIVLKIDLLVALRIILEKMILHGWEKRKLNF